MKLAMFPRKIIIFRYDANRLATPSHDDKKG